MRALHLANVRSATNVVGGLGGVDVTPATLRWALEQARSGGASLAPVYVPEVV